MIQLDYSVMVNAQRKFFMNVWNRKRSYSLREDMRDTHFVLLLTSYFLSYSGS
jgi:hypothetical protein